MVLVNMMKLVIEERQKKSVRKQSNQKQWKTITVIFVINKHVCVCCLNTEYAMTLTLNMKLTPFKDVKLLRLEECRWKKAEHESLK